VSEQYIGEIRLVSFNFPPKGWALCNGQLLPIAQNQALFSLLGTMYGGNGQTTFALPNLQGRTPLHADGNITQGQNGGVAAVTLLASQIPAHSHSLNGTGDFANANVPGGALLAAKPRAGITRYAASGSDAAMATGSLANAGGNQAHENMQPFLVMNYVIALQGIFPSRN
jgi:microcystin-dependent protein